MIGVVKETTSDGKVIIREVRPEEVVPKDHHWILILREMKKRGMADKFKFIYGKKVLEKPLMFAYDEEKGGIGLQKPDKVVLIKTEKEGYWKEDKVVGEIDFNYYTDPDFRQSLRILDLVEGI